MRVKFIDPIIVASAVLSLTPEQALSDGIPHPGGHTNAFGTNSLKPTYKRGMLGTGYWINACTVGVNVPWNLKNKYGTCKSTSYNSHPCSAYVKANSRVTATIEGAVNWMTCKAFTYTSGPFPFSIGKNKYACKHLDYSKTESVPGIEKHKFSDGYYLGN